MSTAIESALRGQVWEVPEGWKPAPVEPTDAMVQAAHHLDLSYMPGQEGADRAAIYRAMLSAAPTQPAQAYNDPIAKNKSPASLMARAYALCPTDLPHLKKMEWLADFYERNRSQPAQVAQGVHDPEPYHGGFI